MIPRSRNPGPVNYTYALCSWVGAMFGGAVLKRIGAPVFIVGTGRCGTSLLVDILKSTQYVNVFPGEALELFHPSLYPYTKRKVESPPYWEDPQLFTQRSIESWPTGYEKRIRRILLGQHFLRGNRKCLVVKSTMINHMLPVILDIFPKMKVLHVVRHGVPFMNSFVKKERKKYSGDGNVERLKEGASRYWNSCVLEVAEKQLLFHESRFLEVRYEDLCADPDNCMQEIGRLLGCEKEAFEYDYGSIVDKNSSSGSLNGSEYQKYLHIMEEGLRTKGYL